ncbi:alpha/beta hydrolase [Geobacter grbiciae]|uniref:alpha/beta hydrolase n=1 Tax=Geobacter grbiciae TaxID=155042 RepID=UPI001C028B7E|nr:alpha/beta hydrolase [Geobacter grbiciae]MBT1077064.1 alpha/beta hydrolase [Geobacter grbiciae]
MLRILLFIALAYILLLVAATLLQRRLLYYPTHHAGHPGLGEWRVNGELIGYSREVPAPENIWLMLHGNGGQASDRAYALSSFSGRDSVYILEYPGYGSRAGSPSMESINGAAVEAYSALRARFPKTPVCVVSESVGSGPASVLAGQPRPPEKMVLIVPFDTLARVARRHFPYLPIGLMLRDRWDNVAALKGCREAVEIFAARDDTIIPAAHARALADSLPSARFHEIPGGHNDWAAPGRVAIRNP